MLTLSLSPSLMHSRHTLFLFYLIHYQTSATNLWFTVRELDFDVLQVVQDRLIMFLRRKIFEILTATD